MGDVDLATYLTVGVVLLGASSLQGAVGFASNLFGIPLLMEYAGMELPAAVTTMLMASLVQNLGGLYHLRKDFDFRAARVPMLIRLTALPLGLWALHAATKQPTEYVKPIIGVVIIVLLVLQTVSERSKNLEQNEQPLHPAWMPLAFGSSGFLVGFCGMGGPPMVLWVMAQRWSSQRSRAFLFSLFISSLPLHLSYLWWQYRAEVHAAATLVVLSIPWIVAGTVAGLWIGARVPHSRLRFVAYTILAFMALKAITAPFL